jgi:hypothetical protein
MKSETNLGAWSVSLDDETNAVCDKPQAIHEARKAIASRASGRLELSEDVGKRAWLARFLGLSPRIQQIHLILEWNGDAACLIFIDAADSEYRVIDEDPSSTFSEKIRMSISHGESKPAPVNECMKLNRALSAINDYLQSGELPNWLRYKYIK